MNEDMSEGLHKINYYTLRMMKTVCPYAKDYYGRIIRNEIKKLMKHNEFRQNEKEFTLEELSKYNGTNGMPAYAAVNGVVYDFSLVPAWGGGTHFGVYSGKDLTKEFNSCHGSGAKILEGIPKVGVVK